MTTISCLDHYDGPATGLPVSILVLPSICLHPLPEGITVNDCVFLVHKPKWAHKAFHDLRLALQPHLPPFLLCVDYSGNGGMFTIAQHTHVSRNSFFYKRELCSCFDRWKLMKPLIACTPALLLPAKMDRNMDPEENQSECLGTSIITLGYSYMNTGQLKESQEKGTLLD